MKEDLFGRRIAVSPDGSRLYVVAPARSNESLANVGGVDVFGITDSGEILYETSLEPPEPKMFSGFGGDLVGLNDMVIVSDSSYDLPGVNSAGRVYSWRYHDGAWEPEIIDDPQTCPNANFGGRIAASDSVLVVSRARCSIGDPTTVASFENRNGQWEYTGEIRPPFDPENSAAWVSFGLGVDVGDDFVVIGTLNGLPAGGPTDGRADVYVRSTEHGRERWQHLQELEPTFPIPPSSSFGINIVFAPPNRIVVAASSVFAFGEIGFAVVFERDLSGAWHQIAVLRPLTADPIGITSFGDGVAMSPSGNRVAITASNDQSISPPGMAYVFDLRDGDQFIVRETDPAADSATAVAFTSESELLIGEPVASPEGLPFAGRVDRVNIDTYTVCRGDVNEDGSVGIGDIIGLLAHWGSATPAALDVDCDGSIGFQDLLFLISVWGDCPVTFNG